MCEKSRNLTLIDILSCVQEERSFHGRMVECINQTFIISVSLIVVKDAIAKPFEVAGLLLEKWDTLNKADQLLFE